ncbi:MAG: hypothetical protein QM757_09430 [Paludibaculum sp.]
MKKLKGAALIAPFSSSVVTSSGTDRREHAAERLTIARIELAQRNAGCVPLPPSPSPAAAPRRSRG